MKDSYRSFSPETHFLERSFETLVDEYLDRNALKWWVVRLVYSLLQHIIQHSVFVDESCFSCASYDRNHRRCLRGVETHRVSARRPNSQHTQKAQGRERRTTEVRAPGGTSACCIWSMQSIQKNDTCKSLKLPSKSAYFCQGGLRPLFRSCCTS